MKRLGIVILLGLVFLTPAFSQSQTDVRLEAIQAAIRTKGVEWQARPNPIWNLAPKARRQLLGWKKELEPPRDPRVDHLYYPEVEETILDWRDYEGHNWMTPVEDQESCGSCWAFGATGALTANIKISANAPDLLINLSEQYLLSCSGGSCNGWSIYNVLNFLSNYGTTDEGCFPYHARDDIPCTNRCPDWQLRIRRIADLGHGGSSVNAIKNMVENGPIEVGFDVYEDFYSYSGGVYHHVWGDYEGGHAVVLLGWSDSLQCWICKNSWGPNWGEYGYFRIGWGECGIQDWAYWMTPDSTQFPFLSYDSVAFTEITGDEDGILNPGETCTAEITLTNAASWAPATSVSAVLRSADPRITILDSIADFGGIPPGTTATNLNHPFTLSVVPNSGICEILLTLDVTTTNQSGGNQYYATFDFSFPITIHQAGFPIPIWEGIRSSPVVVDLDGDGHPEIICGDNAGRLNVWNADGSLKDGFPFSTDGFIWSSPAVGDVNGDGDLEIVFGSKDDTLYVLGADGSLVFKRGTNGYVLATPALADLNGDGAQEIIFGGYDKHLYIILGDGSDYNGFFPRYLDSGGKVTVGAAVADLSGDNILDIVVVTWDHKVHAFSSNGDSLWTYTAGGKIKSAPSVADLDGEGGLEVVFGCDDRNLYILDASGNLLSSVPTDGKVQSSPAFADVDGDGDLEIFSGANDGHFYGIHHDGNAVTGWPLLADGSFVDTSPSFADLDGDGEVEVIFSSSGGSLWALHIDGNPMDYFPLHIGGGWERSSSTTADLDGDGDLEIVLGNGTGLWVEDIKTTAGSNSYWNTFRGNPRRTGYYGDVETAVPIPPREGGIPQTFFLSANFPNPFNPFTTFRYGLPTASYVTLKVYNLLGEEIATPVEGHQKAGFHQLRWNASALPSGVYFYQLKVGNFQWAKKMILLK
ncbi:VCBS repeat-containing protein [candidate division KSB1 bacterium]|nr:VCBS repeat-containing protein [candidate division KSB1 bacterium]